MSDTDAREDLRHRLRDGPTLLLDGPVGTELSRRGVDTSLPLWSARALMSAPEAVAEVHADYVRAGAELVTTNTFRTHRRSLAREGHGDRARDLTRLAVRLARAALQPGAGWIAGSVAPLEDCYSPELTPPDRALHVEHERMCGWLADAGVDLLLVETMPTIREAVTATARAHATGLPVVTGLVCDARGRLLSGESVADAVRALEALEPIALGVNCSPAAGMATPLARLSEASDLPLAAYGNVGYAEPDQGWARTGEPGPEAYAELASGWIELGARLVGSCCGTGPAYTEALARMLSRRASARPRGR